MTTSPDMLTSTMKMLLSLGVVLVVLISLFYVFKRIMLRGPAASSNRLINILASQYIGVKKSISIVQVPGAVLVLGITSDRIQLLSKITNNQAVDSILSGHQTTSGSIFSEQLNKMSALLSRKDTRNG